MKSYIVDSFTTEPFKGNPAGVCILEQKMENIQMLKIAQEFGFSETAFVQKTNKPGDYTIRFFSPKKEIPLCGHATLAAAKVIFNTTTEAEIHFITIENFNLTIASKGNDIIMEFPIYSLINANVSTSMLEALGIEKVTDAKYSINNKIILLEIENCDALANLNPDFNALINSHEGINGVLVTAPANSTEYDYHYRYFWPWAGTNEDPVTGGIQTFLAKYWSEKLGKKTMKAFQSSERTGSMTVELKENKVIIYGQAVIILEGNLFNSF